MRKGEAEVRVAVPNTGLSQHVANMHEGVDNMNRVAVLPKGVRQADSTSVSQPWSPGRPLALHCSRAPVRGR